MGRPKFADPKPHRSNPPLKTLWLFAIFTRKRSFALFLRTGVCALLRSTTAFGTTAFGNFRVSGLKSQERYTDPPILALLDFLFFPDLSCCFCALSFLFQGFPRRESPCFFGGFPCVFPKSGVAPANQTKERAKTKSSLPGPLLKKSKGPVLPFLIFLNFLG